MLTYYQSAVENYFDPVSCEPKEPGAIISVAPAAKHPIVTLPAKGGPEWTFLVGVLKHTSVFLMIVLLSLALHLLSKLLVAHTMRVPADLPYMVDLACGFANLLNLALFTINLVRTSRRLVSSI